MCEGLKQLLKEKRAEERAEIIEKMISYYLKSGKTEEEAQAEVEKILS